MPSPEQQPGGSHPEQERPPYAQAARFPGEQPAGRAYRQAQAAVYRYRTDVDLSTFRLQINQVWHVAVLGETPPEDLEQQLASILAAGEPVSLPDDLLGLLAERRRQAARLGPWVQRHYRPGKRL